ncbi:hypothetical protein SLA2020_179550 [Shorea laevis]
MGAEEVVTVGASKEVLFQEERKEREEMQREFVVYVPLPDEEIERMVVKKKKMELLSKYASEGLLEQQSEAKDMLNIHQ